MLKACIITPNYPRKGFIEKGAFVESLAQSWNELGVSVTVINPISFQNNARFGWNKSYEVYNGIEVYRPSYISYSNIKIGNFTTQRLSSQSFLNATLRVGKLIGKPDYYYGKFLMNGGYAAMELGKRYDIPAFADIGESKLIDILDKQRSEKATYITNNLKGLFCVSERLVQETIQLGANPTKVFLTPNTVDLTKFKPLDRSECRKKLNLPIDKNIVIFVGHYIERKGPLRVLEAVNSSKVDTLAVFIGKGDQQPHGDRVLYAGSVNNNELPIWLNAADVFVLPTLAEGNCNSINEAIACGLPIISSDIPDVSYQVKHNINGILVNPKSIDEIRRAIETLLINKNFREKLTLENLEESKRRYSNDRASSILSIIKSQLLHG